MIPVGCVVGTPLRTLLSDLVKRLDSPALAATNVIPWSSPVPSFGDISRSTVATLGLNPSNREFIGESGRELDKTSRRLHTLTSLGLRRWSDATARHLALILDSCRGYFLRNPYDRWFRTLDDIISGANVSYYGTSATACHLDLIPYATACKWTSLTHRQRSSLLALAGDSLALLLRDSSVRLLIINGSSVAAHLEHATGTRLDRRPMYHWSLPRRSQPDVLGFAYRGAVRELSGIPLGRNLLVLGFNHNIQSSFGVTAEVRTAIRQWIRRAAHETLA